MRRRPAREPTIALINIVFLMLVFFMVAGTLAVPTEVGLRLVQTDNLDGRAPSDALVIHADGRLMHKGAPVADVAAFISALPEEARETVRLLPDRDLAGQDLVAVARALQVAGAGQILIVSERGLE